jgi:hypothetical protein
MVAALDQRRKPRVEGISRRGDLKELTRKAAPADAIRLLVRVGGSRGEAAGARAGGANDPPARARREEEQQVHEWLESPPPLGSVDPMLVPKAHRMKFLRAVESTVAVDGEVTPEERESLLVFAKLIR